MINVTRDAMSTRAGTGAARPAWESGMSGFFAAHRAMLDRAVETIHSRGYWSAFPEAPSGRIYGETAKADAEAAFEALLGKPFELGPGHPADAGRVGEESSPYGFPLGIAYPAARVSGLAAAARIAGERWAAAGIEERVGVCLEILARLNRQSFLIANAVMHTTGQAFVMAFQAGGPHAQDRGLEAVAYAFEEMRRVPATARWEKPAGKGEVTVLDKSFRIVPRGTALAIACATFPTWNSYPGLFASLATGNPVIVKPHPRAVLPLALTVRIGREVLEEAGFDPNALLLAADSEAAPITKDLVLHPEVAIIDFTGSPAFGRWLRENAGGRQVYTEEAGINPVVLDSTDDFKGLCGNLAFSLSLYTGQMCTAPQNIFVPEDGLVTPEGRKSFDEVAQALKTALDRLLGDPDRAAAILGCVQNPAILERVEQAKALGRIVRDAAPVAVPGFPQARAVSPLVVAVEAEDEAAYRAEWFGPISFLIRTASTEDAIRRAAASARAHGAITASLYSTDERVIAAASDAFAGAGVALSVNLTGGIHVNQSAAFSDYHGSGANPAGTASLTDTAFVANRFRVATVRRPAARAA
jgi:phenylacetic acid degradation protein paaN